MTDVRCRRFAMLGGTMSFFHYFFLLKAFEGAPSTVLLPLVQARLQLARVARGGTRAVTVAAEPARRIAILLSQVASVSVLLGSSVIAVLRREQWITPVHALAYVLMFVGGILPATGGHLNVLFKRAFWKKARAGCTANRDSHASHADGRRPNHCRRSSSSPSPRSSPSASTT